MRRMMLIVIVGGFLVVGVTGIGAALRPSVQPFLVPEATDVAIAMPRPWVNDISYDVPGAPYVWYQRVMRNLDMEGWTLTARAPFVAEEATYTRRTAYWFVSIWEEAAIRVNAHAARITVHKWIATFT